MGSRFSFLSTDTFPAPAPLPTPSLGDLPESCVASVLKYLDPPEISRLAVLNRAFNGASSADFVWESKLPSNYNSLIERVFDNFPPHLCKRDIYSMLCRNNYFDGGTKRFWVDKDSGKICLSISSNGLSITGIDDRRYWSRIQTDESRFGSIAYLRQIWWFEVDGEIEFPFPAGTYSVFFRLQLGRTSKRFGRRVCDKDRVHGWDKKPIMFKLSSSNGHSSVSACDLNEPGKWIYHRAGNFTVEDSNELSKIKFSMMEIDCTHSKGGLCVDSVMICPSGFKSWLKNSLV